MGLDITTQINGQFDETFNGRSVFGTLRDYMVKKYNYQYGEDMPLNKSIIKDMVNFLINECFKDNDEYEVSWKMTLVNALMRYHALILGDPKTIITWECDW